MESDKADLRETRPKSELLFAQACFHIVESDGISSEQAKQLKHALVDGGAAEHSASSRRGPSSFDGLTHIVSTTIDFESYEAATDRMIAVVRPSWVEASVLRSRTANPKSHNPDPRLFFSGLVVCPTGLPDGDRDAIIGGVSALGGLYSGAISKLVTHVIALNLEPQACKVALSRHLDCKIVLPHWFDDCFRLGRRIDEQPYLLAHPDAQEANGTQDRAAGSRSLGPDTGLKYHETPLDATLDQARRTREGLDVFAGHQILLSQDLSISAHLRAAIEGLVQKGGGNIATEIAEADTLVCQFRDGEDYIAAVTKGKTVGSLPWMYHLITNNIWLSPLSRLLHYPIARDGLPGFEGFKICLSNYNGEARVFLENLAKAAGCDFTKTMKTDNTHLIAAHTTSEKCEAAREWNIHIVNHLWLEESYAEGIVQSVTNPRYTHFPPRTNLSEIVGQTRLNKAAAEEVAAIHLKSKDTGLRLRDDRRNVNRSSPLRMREPVEHRVEAAGERSAQDADPRSPTARSANVVIRTPALTANKVANKENTTPSTGGSRSAKEKAVAKLHDLAPDIALYEREKKRAGGVLFGRTRQNRVTETSRHHKRNLSTSSDDQPEPDEEQRSKRARKGRPPALMRLLVTGFSKWVEDENAYRKDKERLRDLGILLTSDYLTCTHMAAPRILRTRKFVCAMARAPTILSTDFVEACLEQRELFPVEAFLLNDEDGEKRYRLHLSEACKRARENKGTLLHGRCIYVTKNLHGGSDTYKAIIEINGGTCKVFKSRVADHDRFAQESSDHEKESIYLVSGCSSDDADLWPSFRRFAWAESRTPKIVKTDWLLNSALSQTVHPEKVYELKAASAS